MTGPLRYRSMQLTLLRLNLDLCADYLAIAKGSAAAELRRSSVEDPRESARAALSSARSILNQLGASLPGAEKAGFELRLSRLSAALDEATSKTGSAVAAD